MFVPKLEECGWLPAEEPNGLTIRSCVRGEFKYHRKKNQITWIWFTPAEEKQFLDLVLGHLGRSDRRWAESRLRRLRKLVTRQVQMTIGHDFAVQEGMAAIGLTTLRSHLDGGLGLRSAARRGRDYKLVMRHPRLTARVDEFVSWMRGRLGI